MENLDKRYYLFIGRTDSTLHSPTYLLNQSKIFPKLYHSFNYHYSMTTTVNQKKSRFHGQHLRPSKFRYACLLCYLLFLWLSASCRYLTVPRITVLIHNSTFFPKLFSLPGLLISSCFSHLKINYSCVKTQLKPQFLFEACADFSAFISTSLSFSHSALYLSL